SAAARQSVLDHAFVDPESGELVSAVAYLSGDVRTKLELAHNAAADDDQFNHNVRELEAVVPNDISIKDVTVNPGVHWYHRSCITSLCGTRLKCRLRSGGTLGASSGKWTRPRAGLVNTYAFNGAPPGALLRHCWLRP